MSEKIFIFAKKKNLPFENIVYIDDKGDYPTLENYLREEMGFDPYDFEKSHLNVSYFSEEDLFLSLKHSNSLELRLQEPLIPGKALVICDKDLDLEDAIVGKFNFEEQDYPIFSGEKIESEISKDHREMIVSTMIQLNDILSQMIKAGFLDLKNKDKIDDWIISFQDPLLQIFIRYHKLESSASDITITDEFLINPEFRKTICLMMMKILANFLVNNSYIKIRKVREYKSWKDKKLWSYIKNDILI